MSRFRIILMHCSLPLRIRRKVKKVIEREVHYEKKKTKPHGRNEKAQVAH